MPTCRSSTCRTPGSSGNRLTLNLGVRTEREIIPSFRTDVKAEAFEFGFGKKIAPRLGATFDVLGNGRLKAYGSWGRYFDWVKYELARGSFGGDTWLVNYRSLDTLDVYNLSLSNMPGRDLWGGARDRRVPNFDTIDPDLKPMFQDSTNLGMEYQLTPTTAFGVNYVHNKLTRAIEDVGSLDRHGQRGLLRRQPRRGRRDDDVRDRADGAVQHARSRCVSTTRWISRSAVVSRTTGSGAPTSPSAGSMATTPGWRTRMKSRHPPLECRRPPRSSRPAASLAPALRQGARGTSTSSSGIRTATSTCVGRLATDRPVVAKFYGAYTMPFGTQVGGFVYAGSGTPMSTVVNTLNTIPVLVEGRGDMGRTPFLSRTDLLVSHELRLSGSQKVRLEMNVINLFNQKTATHIFNSLNKGAGLARADSGMDLSHVDLAKGYDYRALVMASPSGANAFDPRYGKADLWQAGTQGQFSIKYIF